MVDPGGGSAAAGGLDVGSLFAGLGAFITSLIALAGFVVGRRRRQSGPGVDDPGKTLQEAIDEFTVQALNAHSYEYGEALLRIRRLEDFIREHHLRVPKWDQGGT